MSNKNIKVLYIDDDERNLNAFHSMFRKHYDIQTALSAKEGLKLMQENHFHILLSDQRMPEMSGTEFFTSLSKTHPHNIKILITAYADIEAIIDGINEGHIYKYVSKPYQKEELMEIIDNSYQVYQYRKQQYDDYTKYKEIFINSNDPIFLVSESGKIIDVNDACLKLLSTSRDNLINKVHNNIFETKIIDHRLLLKLRKEKVLENIEILIQTGRDKFIECLISLKKIVILGDEKISYQGTIKNISDYKLAIRSSVRNLINKQKEEKEKISHILHESSAQNLAGIKFYLSMLSNSNDSSEESKKIIASVQESLDKTIDELRDACFKLMPKSVSFELEGLLNDFSRKMKQEYNVDFKTKIIGDLFDINKDLKMVIFNTIQNVVMNCLSKNGDINLEIKSIGDKLLIDIEGTKLVLSKEEMKHIHTEVDSYHGQIKIHNSLKGRISYHISYPKEISFS